MNVASDSKQLLWAPVDATDIAYEGQVVKWTSDGVANIATASGDFDTSGLAMIAGVVVGTNNVTPVYHDGTVISGYNGAQITGLATQANLVAANHFGQGGMYTKGEKLAMVQIALLGPDVLVKAPIRNAAWATGPTLLTETTGNTAGTTITTNAADFTPAAADLSTIFCRTGANAGSYRVCTDTSTTVHTVAHPFTHDIAIGDTFVKVNIRQGACRMQTDAEGLYIDTGASLATNYWGITVLYMNLKNANEEYAIFKFNPNHFANVRT